VAVKRLESASISFQQFVQDFFEKHLTIERNVSRNTVLSYRDALKLFLRYASKHRGCAADQLDVSVLDVDTVQGFLRWLEQEQKSCARTRNQRLAVLKAFARYVASVAPEHLERCRRLRELPPARFERPAIRYLEEEEITRCFQTVGAEQPRDRALLLTLYNTGARVQEIVNIDLGDLRLDPVPVVVLKGKGGKQRTCPLWPRTVDAIHAWLVERGTAGEALFLNTYGRRLSRSGIAHILQRLATGAGICPQHTPRVSPHVIRHTTAMHLLQSGVDITTIAAWLGHSQLETTHGYVEINLRMKQEALAAMNVPPDLAMGAYPDGELLRWLEALGRRPRYVHSQPPRPYFYGGKAIRST
jgi:integrase/recombinase XerD